MNKKGDVGLSIKTIILFILALVILGAFLFFYWDNIKAVAKLNSCTGTGGVCLNSTGCAEEGGTQFIAKNIECASEGGVCCIGVENKAAAEKPDNTDSADAVPIITEDQLKTET